MAEAAGAGIRVWLSKDHLDRLAGLLAESGAGR
jgi:hypothetical protein